VTNALALPLNVASRALLSGIHLDLNEELTGNLIDQLQQGRVDLALFTDNVSLKGMRCHRLATEELFLIRAASFALPDDGPALSLDTVLGLPLVLSGKEHNHCLRAIVEAAAAEQHLQIGPVAAEINSVHILKSAVLAGIGCTVFPKAIVQHELAEGSLVAHRIGTDGLFRTLVLCASKSIPLTNPKRAVAQLLIDVIGQLCASGEWPGAVAIAHPVGSTLLEENVELA
jgi:LysR family nitrogen assimilation transcriptional regulator